MATSEAPEATAPTRDRTEAPDPDEQPIAEPPRIRVQGTWWRITRGGVDPLFWSPEPAAGRWQRGSVVRALYVGDSDETCWAEWFRHTSEAGVPPQQRLPVAIWRIDVDVEDVADLTVPGILAGEGIARLSPSRRQWPKTQPIGEALWRDGSRGVLAPSAARNGGLVLAIFRPNDGPTASVDGVRPVPPPREFGDLPALPPGLRT